MQRRVVEMFAGVGGFRLGLEASGWQVVWSNQWEPGKKKQWASDCYRSHFPRGAHVNADISTVDAGVVPDHELLVGGFPCQDYSVATTRAEGLHGKKGVLWWEIHRIISKKLPPFVLLENVDRLLKSPSSQRGRDFGVMLRCFADLGYVVEWRVLNAADYGAPQKRRRVFILATRGTDLALSVAGSEKLDWARRSGFFARAFPVVTPSVEVKPLDELPPAASLQRSLQSVSDGFSFRFENAGVMIDGGVWTWRVEPRPEPLVPLATVLEHPVDPKYFVHEKDIPRWEYLKGAKEEPRKAKSGFEYAYTEGPLPFPDNLDTPGRTVMTGEGGISPSRFKHIIRDPKVGRLRVLTPSEVERMNQFPPGWTEGMPEGWRYFCMGNALVVGLVERMGRSLSERVQPPVAEKVVAPVPAKRRRPT